MNSAWKSVRSRLARTVAVAGFALGLAGPAFALEPSGSAFLELASPSHRLGRGVRGWKTPAAGLGWPLATYRLSFALGSPPLRASPVGVGSVSSIPQERLLRVPVSLEKLSSDLRLLRRDLQTAIDLGAVAGGEGGAQQMSQALVLAHWCQERGGQVLTQLEVLSGRGVGATAVARPGTGSGGSAISRASQEARAIVSSARELLQRLRGQPEHLLDEGELMPSGDDVLTRYAKQ